MSRRAGGPPGGARPLEPIHAATSGPDAELFVVEGESAALAVARVRDRERQGLVPMQGKPLNAEPRRSRYDRVLVLTDPDADGIHCGYLVLLFFHRWLRPLLDAGLVEVVRPPWGEVVIEGELLLAFSEPELAALATRARGGGGTVRRFRGLAALDADLLRETCIDPTTRRTERVSTADVAAMIELIGAVQPGQRDADHAPARAGRPARPG